MTISSTTNRIEFAGNGITTVFSFPYYFLAQADLVVILRTISTGVEVTKTLTTHYTVSGAGVAAGGSVTMLTAPTSLESLIIYRDPSATQGLDLVENDALPAESLEQALDRTAMIDQRLKDRVDRSVKLTDGFTGTFDTDLPAILTAGKLFRINDTADGFVLADDATDDAASAAASAATAAAAAGALTFPDAKFKVFADSPITLVNADNGDFYAVDCTNGNVSITLPVIAVLTTNYPWVVGFKKTDSSANSVTINRASTDTIDGATAKVLSVQNQSCYLIPSATPTPDTWTSLDYGPTNILGITTKTTTYQALSGDDVILCDGTSASFTVTLPAAASIAGKVLRLKKIDSDATKIITIDGSGSETIDGVATISLTTFLESVELVCDGTNWRIISRSGKAPSSQIFTSGSGTYTTPLGAKYIRVKLVGAGAGGGGSGTSGGTSGGTGGNTTFSTLTGNGGTAGGQSSTGYVAGGTSSGGDINIAGGGGNAGGSAGGGAIQNAGFGGQSQLGSGGCGGFFGSAGQAAAGYGGGGGGGGPSGTATGAAGGGGGGYAEKVIFPVSTTYSYAVGAAGTAGSAGTAGFAGTAGTAGIVIVEEYYS